MIGLFDFADCLDSPAGAEHYRGCQQEAMVGNGRAELHGGGSTIFPLW